MHIIRFMFLRPTQNRKLCKSCKNVYMIIIKFIYAPAIQKQGCNELTMIINNSEWTTLYACCTVHEYMTSSIDVKAFFNFAKYQQRPYQNLGNITATIFLNTSMEVRCSSFWAESSSTTLLCNFHSSYLPSGKNDQKHFFFLCCVCDSVL